MRHLPTFPAFAILLLSLTATAQDRAMLEPTKRGILPNGGFYTLYSVTCSGQRVVEVASTDRRQRWCALSGDDLACFRTAAQASDEACANPQIASSVDDGDEVLLN